MSDYRIIVADVMKGLASMADESCQVCVTSPPYWGLRDYSVDGQIGLEPTLDAFIEKMVSVFREVRRVLRKDGCLFLNLGDSYASCGGMTQPHRDSSGGIGKIGTRGTQGYSDAGGGFIRGNSVSHGLKPKDLCGVPWRVALALQADGWYLRSAMPWLKRSCMPESCRDRPTSAIEYVFMLTKSSRYYWDADAVRVAHVRVWDESNGGSWSHPVPTDEHGKTGYAHSGKYSLPNPSGRNFRNSDIFYQSIKPPHGLISDANGDPLAMDVNPQAFSEAHFATYPEKLVEPLILASTSAKGCCPECGAWWVRVVEVTDEYKSATNHLDPYCRVGMTNTKTRKKGTNPVELPQKNKTLGWQPGCECYNPDHVCPIGGNPDDYKFISEPVSCVVLDPFSGSGTTGVVALRHNREYIGIELSEEYAAMSRKRIEKSQRPNTFRDHDTRGDAPLFRERT